MLQAKQERVTDWVFIGSDINEINTSSAKNFWDLRPKEKEAVPEMICHFKTWAAYHMHMRKMLIFKYSSASLHN